MSRRHGDDDSPRGISTPRRSVHSGPVRPHGSPAAATQLFRNCCTSNASFRLSIKYTTRPIRAARIDDAHVHGSGVQIGVQ